MGRWSRYNDVKGEVGKTMMWRGRWVATMIWRERWDGYHDVEGLVG
jgi:hypothetical protein